MKTNHLLFTILLAVIAIAVPNRAIATPPQTDQPGNEHQYIHDGIDYLLILPAESSKNDVSNVKLGFRKGYIEKFIHAIEKYGKKAKQWAATAARENVTDYSKPLHPTIYTGGVPVKRIYYTAEGQRWYNNYDNSALGMNPLTMVPQFIVNPSGQSYFRVICYVGEKKLSTGNVIESTTTTPTGVFGTDRVVGHSVSREVKKIDCGSFYIDIPVEELDSYLAQLKQYLRGFDQEKAAKKATDKLFK